MIKLAPSRRMLIAGRQPASRLLAIRPSGAFSNIRKNLFLTLLNFNDPFELCHQHLIILGKKKVPAMTPIWHVGKYTCPQRPAPLPSSPRRFHTDFLPRKRGLFSLIVFANTDQMKRRRRGYQDTVETLLPADELSVRTLQWARPGCPRWTLSCARFWGARCLIS